MSAPERMEDDSTPRTKRVRLNLDGAEIPQRGRGQVAGLDKEQKVKTHSFVWRLYGQVCKKNEVRPQGPRRSGYGLPRHEPSLLPLPGDEAGTRSKSKRLHQIQPGHSTLSQLTGSRPSPQRVS